MFLLPIPAVHPTCPGEEDNFQPNYTLSNWHQQMQCNYIVRKHSAVVGGRRVAPQSRVRSHGLPTGYGLPLRPNVRWSGRYWCSDQLGRPIEATRQSDQMKRPDRATNWSDQTGRPIGATSQGDQMEQALRGNQLNVKMVCLSCIEPLKPCISYR